MIDVYVTRELTVSAACLQAYNSRSSALSAGRLSISFCACLSALCEEVALAVPFRRDVTCHTELLTPGWVSMLREFRALWWTKENDVYILSEYIHKEI